jgi:uncharacterized membrane protein
MTPIISLITTIIIALILLTLGILVIKTTTQISENIYYPIKQKLKPKKKNATKRIRKSTRKV